jgi:hypothetical protein
MRRQSPRRCEPRPRIGALQASPRRAQPKRLRGGSMRTHDGPGRAASAGDWGIAGRRSPSLRLSSRAGQLARPAIHVRFRPFKNVAGTMLGWLRLEFPSGLIVNDAKLMIGRDGRRWVALPAAPQVHADGSLRVIDGKKAWRPIVEFQSKAVRERFETQVLGALRASHPALFKGEPE